MGSNIKNQKFKNRANTYTQIHIHAVFVVHNRTYMNNKT
jgi:hypothetical protein